MNYYIYLNSKKLNRCDTDAIAEYSKRLNAYCSMHLICKASISLSRITEQATEHTRFFFITPGTDTPSSEDFAVTLEELSIHGCSTIYFFVGYSQPEPPIPTLSYLSLSSMELSVGLTGVVLYEQLYRSYRIRNHQPYHK